MYTKIILVDTFTDLQCHSLWGSACHYVVLHYSHCKSGVLFLLCMLIHCSLLLAPLIAVSQTAHCSLLVASFTTTPVSLCLVLNIGAVAWRHTFSKPLRVSRAGWTSSQTFDIFSKHSKKWRILSWLHWHRRPEEGSHPRPVQMGHCYSVLAVTGCRLMGSDVMWSGRW
jgi:hypothetical protein